MPKSSTRPSVVLAVDDSPDALGLISRILEAENMTTLVALDGHQKCTCYIYDRFKRYRQCGEGV